MMKALSSDGQGVHDEVQARESLSDAEVVKPLECEALRSLLRRHGWQLQAWGVFAGFLSVLAFQFFSISWGFRDFPTVWSPSQRISVSGFQLISWVCSVCILLS